MNNSVGEKANQRQKKPLTKLAPHNSHTSGQDSDTSQLDDQTEEEEDEEEEEEVPITRRIIISDGESPVYFSQCYEQEKQIFGASGLDILLYLY